MIWLAWHRHRSVLVVVAGGMALLALWMAHLGHGVVDIGHGTCLSTEITTATVANECAGRFSVGTQGALINGVLLVLPCLLGLVFGAPLVAGELEHATNRLVWTQGRTRTRWYVTTWLALAVTLAALVGLLTLVTQWWSGHSLIDFPQAFSLGGSRIQPSLFAVTGVVPVTYTVFALALGGTLGAVLRRTTWAVAGVVVVYAVVALAMALGIRSTLAPTGFLTNGSTDSGQYAPLPNPAPWNVAYQYRVIPGYHRPASAPSLDQVAAECIRLSGDPSGVVRCMKERGVEGGFVYQSPGHYWRLQFGEAAIYLALAALLFAGGLWSVRRQRD